MKKMIIVGLIVTMMVVLTGCTKKIERTVTIHNPSSRMLEEITLTENQLIENQLVEHLD